jgi:hypothetical protein
LRGSGHIQLDFLDFMRRNSDFIDAKERLCNLTAGGWNGKMQLLRKRPVRRHAFTGRWERILQQPLQAFI